jgi:tetratricopeptide (TPR) repeat protein
MKKLKNKSIQPHIPLDEPAPWPRSQQYLPHAIVCEELIKQWDITLDEASTLLNNARVYLRACGQYQEAAPLSEHALSIQEKMYGHDHPSTNSLLNNLALLYNDQGKDDEAAPLYLRALAIREKVFGPDHPRTKDVRENYTDLLQKMGQKTEHPDQPD